MKKIILHVLFVVIVAGDLGAEYLQDPRIETIFKPLIMVWIGTYFLLFARKADKMVYRLAAFAFLFSWFGDMLMMRAQESNYFLLGIVSFLVAQILYAFLFLRTICISGKKPFLKKKPVWLTPYIAFGLIVYIVLFPHLNEVLRVAVFIYILAILIMSAMALNRYGNGHPLSFGFVFAGSLFFVLSDLLIAFNRFLLPIPYEGMAVMSTYMAAQFLIMKGILKQYE